VNKYALIAGVKNGNWTLCEEVIGTIEASSKDDAEVRALVLFNLPRRPLAVRIGKDLFHFPAEKLS
jgi:hypothetical protein